MGHQPWVIESARLQAAAKRDLSALDPAYEQNLCRALALSLAPHNRPMSA